MNNEIKVTIVQAQWNPELGVFVAHLAPSGGAVQTEELVGREIIVTELPNFIEYENVGK